MLSEKKICSKKNPLTIFFPKTDLWNSKTNPQPLHYVKLKYGSISVNTVAHFLLPSVATCPKHTSVFPISTAHASQSASQLVPVFMPPDSSLSILPYHFFSSSPCDVVLWRQPQKVLKTIMLENSRRSLLSVSFSFGNPQRFWNAWASVRKGEVGIITTSYH